MINFANSLDENSFELWEETFIKIKNDIILKKKNEICQKRKIEKQSYFPNKIKMFKVCFLKKIQLIASNQIQK